MSQLPTGQVGPMSGIRVRRGDDRALGSAIPRVGQTASLGVYGITPDPVDFRADQQAESLMRALGIASRGLEITADEARRQQAIAEQEAIKQERVWRGRGAERNLEITPQILADIQARRVAPNEGESATDFADRILSERAGFDPDPENAAFVGFQFAELRERASPLIQKAVLGVEEDERRKGIEQVASLLVSQSVGKSLDEMRQSIKEYSALTGASEEASTALFAARSMEYAATLGDRERFNEAASLLPENSVDRLKYQNALETTIRQRENEQRTAFHNEIAGLYIDNEPFDAIEERIMQRRGSVPETAIEDSLNELESRKSRAMTEEAERAALIYNTDIERQAIDNAVTEIDTAFDRGGLLNVKDVEWTDPLGKSHKLSADEIRETAVNRVFDRIDQSGLTPEQALAEKSAVLAYNGYKYQGWASTLAAGPAAGVQAFTAIRNGEPVTSLPATLRDGYSLYKSLAATNPSVLAMHVGDDANTLYGMASLAETYIDKGDPQAALFRAMQADGRRAFGTISSEEVIKRTEWIEDATNSQDMAATVRDVASLMLGSGVVPNPETAIKEASKIVKASHRKINGSYVNVRDRSIPPNIEEIGDAIIDKYFNKYGESEGLSKKNLTLVPMPGSTDGWVLHNRASMSPVEQDGEWLYRTSDLADVARRMDAERRRVAGESLQVGQSANQRNRYEDRMIAAALGLAERPRVTRNGLETFTPPTPRTDPFAE